ncbi:DUF167 domain-containing protein [Paracoccus aerodenitrificans]|uniref:DUF167 domain-containing protein n=1 Tax=Paracoccus aerodenitrificans TaxID=3017781 RepID=UPI0022F046B2|nr:DUF167 domain-containing protein [Paracoccus aerodenitrificans]WBU65658.1 DUF167 domain-containing protein [Paracoccus aerodenitrificans]
MDHPDLTHLAAPGTSFDVRVTPKAGANRITSDDSGMLRVQVTAVPENGKATAAVIRLLAKAIGIPKSRLILIRGETSRDKSFRVDP